MFQVLINYSEVLLDKGQAVFSWKLNPHISTDRRQDKISLVTIETLTFWKGEDLVTQDECWKRMPLVKEEPLEQVHGSHSATWSKNIIKIPEQTSFQHANMKNL